MAESFLYLTTKGRKSGEPRQIEIWFVEHENRFYLCSERREASNWVQNIAADAAISWSVGSREDPQSDVAQRHGHGRIIDAKAEPELARKVKSLLDKKYDWSDGLLVELRAN